MVAAPKSPKAPRGFADHGELSLSAAAASDRRDHLTGAPSGGLADADLDPAAPGRFGNLNQNLTAMRNVQDR